MPLDGQRIADEINKKRGIVGTLGRELAAIRKAALGTGPVQPGHSGPAQTDNEAGEKPSEPAAPDAEEDIGHPNAPETLTGGAGKVDDKQLTPAQKAARNLADSLGLLPDQKAKIPFGFVKGAGMKRVTRGLEERLAMQRLGKTPSRAKTVPMMRRGSEGEINKYMSGGKTPSERLAADAARGNKSAEQLAEEFYLERGEKGLRIPPGILAKFKGGLRKVPGMFKHELMNTPSSTIGGIAGVAGTGILLEQQRRERKRQGKLASLFGIKQAEALAEQFYLERGEKGAIGKALGKFARKPTRSLHTSEVRRLLEKEFPHMRRKASYESAGKDFMPRNEEEQTQEMPNPLPPGSQGEPEDNEPIDPAEMQSLRSEMDLTPLESQLLDEMVQDGGGIESVDAGQEPQEVMAPRPELGTPKGDNMPTNGMEMYGQAPMKAPAQDKPPQEAVHGQGPTETEPGTDLESSAVARPDAASYQSEPEGSETSEAVGAPQGNGAIGMMTPGASRAVMQPPPMTRQEASDEGQTEEEAFQSLVAKIERAQEKHQSDEEDQGQKSLQYDDKGVGRLLMKLGGAAARFMRKRGMQGAAGSVARGFARAGSAVRGAEGAAAGLGKRVMAQAKAPVQAAAARAPNTINYAKDAANRARVAAPAAVNRMGNVLGGTGQIRGGVLGRAMEKTGNFMAARPRTSMGIAAGATGAMAALPKPKRRYEE